MTQDDIRTEETAEEVRKTEETPAGEQVPEAAEPAAEAETPAAKPAAEAETPAAKPAAEAEIPAAEKPKKGKLWITEVVLLIIQAASACLLLAYVGSKGVLPGKYLLAAGIILAAAAAGSLLLLLLNKNRKKAPAIAGIVLSAFFAFLCIFAFGFLKRTYDSLARMLNEGQLTMTSEVNIYTRKEDEIENLEDLKGKTLGVLELLDKKNTEIALERIGNLTGEVPQTKAVGGILTLARLLSDGETDAILLNAGLHDVVAENLFGFEFWAETTQTLDVTRRTITKMAPDYMAKLTVTHEQTEEEIPEIRPFLIYLSGLDTRGVTSVPDVGNSDVNMIVAVNPQTKRILLVNIPRDYYYYLWGDEQYPDKLTHSGYYGPDCGMATLNAIFGIDTHYYVKVCFSSVINIVDALGGITVYSDMDFGIADCSFHEGENYLNGYQALQFARVRKTISGGDRTRGMNQQKVIRGIVDKITSPVIVRRFNEVLDAITANTRTNIPMDTINALVKMQLSDMAVWEVEAIQVDGAGDWQFCYSLGSANDVMVPDMSTVETAKARISEVLYENQRKAN